jgi:hypothetical protein
MYPAKTAAHIDRVRARHRTKVVHAADAGASSARQLYATTGPNAAVIGQTSRLPNGIAVIQAIFTPLGTKIIRLIMGLSR